MLPAGIARLRAEGLVAHVVRAQRVAVHEQYALAFDVDDARVGQDRHARAARVGVAEQEVAVAVHVEHGNAGSMKFGERVGDGVFQFARGIVADPRLEEVAEDVQRIGLAGFLAQEGEELLTICGRVVSRCRSEMNKVVMGWPAGSSLRDEGPGRARIHPCCG